MPSRVLLGLRHLIRGVTTLHAPARENCRSSASVVLPRAYDRLLHSRRPAGRADRYVIRRELGRGGMATVYLAHDLKHERDLAIKVLHPDLGAALGAERFLSEIRTTARLQHPHILPLHDSGDAGMSAASMTRARTMCVCALQSDYGVRLRMGGRITARVAQSVVHIVVMTGRLSRGKFTSACVVVIDGW